jgi:DNA polymerase III subunit delta'
MNENGEFKFNWPVLGHQNIIKYLQRLIISKQFVSSYLFFGPEDIGKKTVVNFFVRSIFCFENQGSDEFPCGKCKDCKDIEKRIHPGYIEINLEEEKKNISIDQVRELKERLYLTSATGSYKVAIINQADLLSIEASNALLKLIEEPPKNSIIILITKKVENILPTIRSRTQNIIFHNVSLKEIREHLVKNGVSEKLARELAEFSGGIPGLAMSYYKDLDSWNKKKNNLNEMLDILDQPINTRLAWVDEQIKLAKKSSNQYIYFETILNSYLRLIRDTIVFQINNDLELIHPFLKELINKISGKYQSGDLIDFYQNILEGKRSLGQNVSPKIILENLLLI